MHEVLNSFKQGFAPGKVKGQDFRLLGQVLREEFFYDKTRAFMDFLTFFFEQAVVNHFLGEGMSEIIVTLGKGRVYPDETETYQVLQVTVEVFFTCGNVTQN